MNYDFTKQGVLAFLDRLMSEWYSISEIKISINNDTISVPMCADNANEVDYMLKDMLVSDIIGRPTIANSFGKSDELDEEFDRL